MITFSHNNVLKFIELIREQRDLYDPNSTHFKSKNKRAKIWEEIATKCNKKRLSGNTCKNLWNKLKRSYARFKKTGSVVTNRTYAKSKIFELMTFLEVKKQQGNEKKPQANEKQPENNENKQQGNANQQQGNANQQQGKEKHQQDNVDQEKTNENKQQSKVNQPQGNENQQQDNKKNIGPKTKNSGKNEQGNETKFGKITTDGLFDVKDQQTMQKKSIAKNTASQSGHTLQNAMPSVQLNISGVEINLGSKSNEEIPQSLHESLPAAKPKPSFRPQQWQNEDKSMEDELHLFATQVRTTLGNLPRELQINAQEEVFQVLSKYKTLALLSMSASESSRNNTE